MLYGRSAIWAATTAVNPAAGPLMGAIARRGLNAFMAALGELGMKDLDELYENIGLGERLALIDYLGEHHVDQPATLSGAVTLVSPRRVFGDTSCGWK